MREHAEGAHSDHVCPLCYGAIAFDRRAVTDEGEQALTFRYDEGQLVDIETGNVWDVTEHAIAGPLEDV